MMILWSTIIATLVGLAYAVVSRTDPGFYTLNQNTIDSTNLYAHYVSAVKCQPQTLPGWKCGPNCMATPNFELYANGGDGNKIQFWMVGYDNAINSVIIAHQGTNFRKFFADLTDLKFLKTGLDPSLFPNIPNGIQVHRGFAEEQAKTAASVLQAVDSLLMTHPDAMVTVLGHSLGAAIALLDGVRLRLLLAPTIDVRVLGYGMPRVGNPDFVNLVDAILPKRVIRINNKLDPVPTVPAMSFGYHHVLGEIHIQETDGEWITCPGIDNEDPRCIVGAVPSIFYGNFSDHSGPYNRIMLKCNG